MDPNRESSGAAEPLEAADLARLIQVQRLDEKVARAEATKHRRPMELTQRLEARDAQKKKVEAAKQIIQDTKKRIDSLTVESGVIDADIKKLDGQLFNLKSNEEFNAMKSQIAHRHAKNGEVQDKILELMMASEELEAAWKAETAALAEEQALLERAEQRTKEDLADAEKRIAELAKERQELIAQLPSSLVERYEYVRGRRDGVGLAHIEDEICKGCDTRIMSQVIAGVMAGNLMQCPHCDRILRV
ncbi:MAG: hypothetical protein KDB53_19075 [Planctomycetes bacterium]|nr:hypothetical protein [Planctomycetota bacterium]